MLPEREAGVDKGVPEQPPCVSSALCTQANSGQASRCPMNGGKCTPWQTKRCHYPSGGDAWMSENALVIGSIQPFTVKQVVGGALDLPYAKRIQRAIDLALDEVAAKQPGGLLVPGGPQRPIAVIHCDSSLDPAGAIEAFTHLTDTVKVAAVIVGSDEDLAAVAPLAAPHGTAIICSDCVGTLPSPPRAWRVIPPLALQAPMAARRVADLEAKRKAEPDPPARLRVALLANDALATEPFVTSFLEALTFNGKTGAENLAQGDLRVVKSERPTDHVVPVGQHVADLQAFRPDVIVVAMGTDFPGLYLGLIEQDWPADKPRPYYVLTDLSYDVESFQAALPASKDELRLRISGTRNGYDPVRQANADGFENRYRLAYNGEPPSGNWSGYEAFYALLYAIEAGALDSTSLDGGVISGGFGRLLGGPDIDVGQGNLSVGLASFISPSSTINLRGLWSPLDWNVTTHDLTGDVSMFCFERYPSGFLKLNPNAGPHYVTSTKVFSNSYACD